MKNGACSARCWAVGVVFERGGGDVYQSEELRASAATICNMLLTSKEILQPEYAEKVFALFKIALDDNGLIAPACDIINHYMADPKYRKERQGDNGQAE